MQMLPLLERNSSGTSTTVGIEQILSAVRSHLGMEASFVSEFRNGRRIFRHVECAKGKEYIEIGGSDPLEDSYCWWIAQGKLPQLIRDPAEHPFTDNFAATRTLPVGAHLSVPITLRNGLVYGTFCCFSTVPDRSLTGRDLATMQAFAQLAADQIQTGIDHDTRRQTNLGQIESVIAGREIDILFQPAVRIDRPEIAFVEALARFRPKPYRTPDQWFAAAHEVELGTQLELLAVELALTQLHTLPGSTAMAVNVSPDTLRTREMLNLLAAAPLDRIIIEVTEHREIANYAKTLAALAPLRKRGLRIAVDDAGAGYASLRHILLMHPDIIKLDMSLTRGIHRDPVRRALASAMIHFAEAIGSELVAEGVESPAELASLRALNVTIVQGHLFAKASPIGDIPVDIARRAAA